MRSVLDRGIFVDNMGVYHKFTSSFSKNFQHLYNALECTIITGALRNNYFMMIMSIVALDMIGCFGMFIDLIMYTDVCFVC